MAGKTRKIQSYWFNDNAWLRYSMSARGVFCAPCFLFSGKDKNSKFKSFAAVAVTDPSNLGKMIKIHASSEIHLSSSDKAEHFIGVMKGEKKGIDRQMNSSYGAVIEKNRQILLGIVDAIILCGKQNLALRGHEEKDSNFEALLEYQAKHNPILKEHLLKGDPRSKYTSLDIQNELIDICGGIIKDGIVEACNRSGFFGFIADEATDAATMEQMAMCLRYYDTQTKVLREDFIGFAECSSTTGEVLSDAFLTNLRQHGVLVDNMRGQGYDGAANMSGRYRGVQARIKEVIPGALYTHCKAHSLNLAIIHASREPYPRNMMDVVQDVAFAFNYSAKRLLNFQDNLANDPVSRAEMERRTKLQSLCETRWAARADALLTFRSAFTTVVSALEDLWINHGDTKAGTRRNAVLQFEFVVTLVAVEHVLSGLVPLSQLLQKKSCDLVEAVVEARVVKTQLSAERNAIYNRAVDLAALVEIQPSQPRRALHQQQRPNAAAANPSDFWKRNMYLPFIDHLVTELENRLLQGSDRFKAQFLLPSKVANLTDDNARDIYAAFQPDLPDDEMTFVREARRWKVRWENVNQQDPIDCLAETLATTNRDLYPNMSVCLNVLLVMPVSTATAERSFSTMRRVKTYLRSTMSTGRLSGLGLLNIYKDKQIDTEAVVEIFARRKPRRLAFIFRH